MKKLRIILQSRCIFKILVIIFLLGALIFTNFYNFESKYSLGDNTFIGVVTKYELQDKKIVLEIKAEEKLIVNYKYGDKIFNNLSYGDKVLVKGTLKEPSIVDIPNAFNYKKYLYNKRIYYLVEAESIDKLENNSDYIYTIKNILYRRINKLKSSNYMKLFLLGDNTLNFEVNNSYRINGISHLFSISGMHISLITNIFYFYLDRVTYNKKIKYIIASIFLILYFLLVGTSSLLRSIIMNILFSVNFIFKLNIKKLDIMFITLIIAIIFDPFIIYDIGFIYSYLISFFLIMCSSKIKGMNSIFKTLNITLISFFVSFPITIYNNCEINIISIVMNIILVPIVSIIIFPLTIITFCFPIFDNILHFLTNLLEDFSLFVSNIELTRFIFLKPSLLVVIIYYIIIVIVINRRKYWYLLFTLIIVHYFAPYFDNNFEIMMFDVGQGDSILIKYPYNQGNILIDTGKDSYIMTNGIIPYLKSMGIRKIDYLIITHGDLDHIGEAINLVNNFKVEKAIFNCGEFNKLEQDLIKILDKKKILYHSCINELNIDGNKLYFLNDRLFDNENDNSSVLYFEYLKYKFLFMGDASFVVEDYLLEKYNLSDISFLKVGHHGSSTSSSSFFIDMISPKISLISVGINNYGHPNDIVINNLNDSLIYRTDFMGSVCVKINSNDNIKIVYSKN